MTTELDSYTHTYNVSMYITPPFEITNRKIIIIMTEYKLACVFGYTITNNTNMKTKAVVVMMMHAPFCFDKAYRKVC